YTARRAVILRDFCRPLDGGKRHKGHHRYLEPGLWGAGRTSFLETMGHSAALHPRTAPLYAGLDGLAGVWPTAWGMDGHTDWSRSALSGAVECAPLAGDPRAADRRDGPGVFLGSGCGARVAMDHARVGVCDPGDASHLPGVFVLCHQFWVL